MIEQILPRQETLSLERWNSDRKLFLERLSAQANDPTWYCQSFNPYPLSVPKADYDLQKRLQQVLCRAIKALVTNYFKDRRLQDFYGLSPQILELMQAQEHLEYRLGSYRPDLLLDANGGIKICEINARFPANGYFISQYINNIAPKLAYLSEYLSNAKLRMVKNNDNPLDAFMARFPKASQVYIAKESEKGWDAHFLNFELNSRGHRCQFLAANELANLSDCEPYSYLVLELHQREILAEANYAHIDRLTRSIPYFNDLRTIFVVHDKRFLALLHRQDIMADYLPAEDLQFLQKHVVPTYVIKDSAEVAAAALNNQAQWLLKPNLFGKGEGIVIGKSVPQDAWRQALTNAAGSDYILQHYIEQKQFPIVCAANGEITATNMNVVGTMLCFDESFFGPGIYRASTGDIVNVAGGGTILFPIATT